MGEWTNKLMKLDEDLCFVDAETGQWIIAEFDSGIDDERESDATCGNRAVACWNAMLGIPDPAATMTEVVEVLRDCAEDLESMVEAHYGGGIKDHPAMKPKYERDMEPAERARALLAKLEGK